MGDSLLLWRRGRPHGYHGGGIAQICTLGLILAVHKAHVYLWKHSGADIKALFAPIPIDKQEVFAYLLADALGRPLLHKSDARGVGQRGDNGLTKANSEIAKVKAATYMHRGASSEVCCQGGLNAQVCWSRAPRAQRKTAQSL